MGKKGYALVEAVTAVALVMMASGILSLGISFGLRMERRAEQLKDTDTVQEVPARFRMRTWDGTVISGELRYAKSVSLSEKPWNRIDGDTFGSFSDVEIGIRAAGERSLWLTVRVNQGEELLYERTGRVELLNVPFYGTGRLEGSGRTGQSAAEGASYPAVWYIDGGDS